MANTDDRPKSTFWRVFFDAHAPRYMENEFTRHTEREVQFFLNLNPLPEGASILDVGCGTGRHAVELAKRGYHVVGVDFSAGMLGQAKVEASNAGVEVEWVHADATEYVHPEPLDAAICLCEGAINLTGPDEEPIAHDLAILRNISASLKPSGPLLMTALNGYSLIRQMKDEHVAAGSFDPATMIAHYEDEWELPEGKRTMRIRERLFTPPEMVSMLVTAGFEVLNVWGGTAGDWGRRPVKLDEIEVMFVARKRA